MSGKRRSAGPIRQLSLQHPPSSASRRPPLKKQQSVDSDRLWSVGNSVNGDVGLRVTASSIRSGGHFQQEITASSKKSSGNGAGIRPRPVKLAWTDRRQQSFQQENQNQTVQPINANNVEVVAKRFMGQPRPITAKPPRTNASNLPAIGGERDSILYTRQQLAERLRKAWKERESSRPNLDIFLAHNNINNSTEDEPSNADNGINVPSDIRSESLLTTSETPVSSPSANEDIPSVGNLSPSLPSYSPHDISNNLKSKPLSPQSSSNNLLYSSTAVGISKNLQFQKNTAAASLKKSFALKSDIDIANSSNDLLSSNPEKNLPRSANIHRENDMTFTSAFNTFENVQNTSNREITFQQNSHNNDSKLKNVNFNVFPKSSVIITPKSSPKGTIDNITIKKNTEDISPEICPKIKSRVIPEQLDDKDKIEMENLNHNNPESGEIIDTMADNVISNKSSDFDEKGGGSDHDTVSERQDLSNKIVVDVSPRKKETVPPTTSSHIITQVDRRTRNEKESEFNRNEAKENKINADSTKSYSTVNNKENSEVVQLSPTQAVSRIPNTAEIMSATVRRVNFRNSVNKTITGSFSSDVPPSPIPSPVVTVTKSTPTPPSYRVLSAPPQRLVPKSAPPKQVPSKSILVQRNKRLPLQSAMSVDMASECVDITEGEDGEEEGGSQVRGERNIRSAPARRRLKTAGPRRKSRGRGEESSGDEAEVGAKEKEKSSATRVGRRGLARGAEIVTMVSLMSDGSDVDADPTDPFLQPAPGAGIAPWMEEKNPTRLTQNEQTSAPPRVVCLRKTPKSVTFQQQPSPQSNSSPPIRTTSPFSVARRVVPGTPTEKEKTSSTPVVPTVISTSKDLYHTSARPISREIIIPEAKIIEGEPDPDHGEFQQQNSNTETEQQDCPKVLHSKKDIPSHTEEISVETAVSCTTGPQQQEKVPSPRPNIVIPEPPSTGLGVMVARILKPEHTPISESCDILENAEDAEPEFQTPKERECWQLYRRMLEKGVSVSYDTVLRGMLTPTEYRLRRNALVRQLV